MGWLHAGHRSLLCNSRGLRNASSIATLFVNPSSSTAPPTSPGARGRGATCGSSETKASISCSRRMSTRCIRRSSRRRSRSADLRRCSRVRRGRRALRWRRDGRLDPVQPGRRGRRVLRAEGRAAGHGDHADGAGPRASRSGWSPPDRARAHWHGPVLAKRCSPEARAASPVIRSALMAAAGALHERRAIGRCAARRPVGGPDGRTARQPGVRQRRVAGGQARAEVEIEGETAVEHFGFSMAVRFGEIRLIGNERLSESAEFSRE